MVSNIKPAMVGATVLKDIRAKLLIPMAVAVSLGSTMPVAKVCLIGMVNIITTRRAIRTMTAKGK